MVWLAIVRPICANAGSSGGIVSGEFRGRLGDGRYDMETVEGYDWRWALAGWANPARS